MEDILTKNIFSDKELLKLSPDYCPIDVTLRMQERRTMFKDVHGHNILTNSNWSRKIQKKDEYKINKEIVKLRNVSHNMNLRNQMLVQKYVRNSAPKSELDYSSNLLLNDLKVLHDNTDKCIQDVEDDFSQLILYNNNEFKVNNKPKQEKVLTENRRNKIKTFSTKKTAPIDTHEEHLKEHTIRIDCIYSTREEPVEYDFEIQEDTLPPILDSIDLKINSLSTSDAQNNDLQALLMNMTISKPNKSEDRVVYGSSNCKTTIDTIQVENGLNSKVNHFIISSKKSDTLNITPPIMEMSEKEIYLTKKFLKKWREYVIKRKEIIFKQRQATLSIFFDKLSRKKLDTKHSFDSINKSKGLSRDYDTYQHRYKVQKQIIALQKVKLEEQNRVIEKLKYNNILEASRQSVDAMKEEVRKTYYEIDRQLKPKIKCLTNELNLHEIEEPSLVLHCLKVPKFLQRMEKRAREREEKHAVIRERRRQMEEERIRLKQQAEIAKAEMDKEEKIKRIQELRDQRRKEKIETIRRKQYAARLRSLIVMADLHYEKSLTVKYGIRPFRILLQIKRDNIEKASHHYSFQLKKNILLNWMWYTEDMLFERNYIAEEFYRKKMLIKVFGGLKLNVREYTLKKQVATDYYDLFITQLVFRKFREAINIVKKENEAKWHKAIIYHNSNLVFKILTCWRTLPALNALKREQDARKARWREKVLIVVPDYVPPDD